MLSGKTILLGVTGGIAAYKSAMLASALVREGAAVHVLMTGHATEFIAPLTFETLTANRVSVDTFDRNFQWNVQHVSLAKKADLFCVAPATANVLAKMAMGLADDMLTTTLLAASCPKLVAPAMNTGMYNNPVTQRNFAMLKELGVSFVDAETGHLACGDDGKGRMAEPEEILAAIRRLLTPKDMKGLRVLVTAGPTEESLDPVRFLTNHSTGKMGYAMAENALARGAGVTLVTGPVSIPAPAGAEVIRVRSALEMREAVLSRAAKADLVVMAAAVADYRPEAVSADKIKKSDGEMTLPLVRNPDILKELGQTKRPGQLLCGFSMETRDLVENSAKKLTAKHCDLIAANNLRTEGAGFGTETNVMTLLTREGAEELPLLPKGEVAARIFDRLLAMR